MGLTTDLMTCHTSKDKFDSFAGVREVPVGVPWAVWLVINHFAATSAATNHKKNHSPSFPLQLSTLVLAWVRKLAFACLGTC